MRKKTIEEIKQELLDKTNGEVKLLSEEYINSNTKMKFQCKCGEIFERAYKYIHKGSLYCRNCAFQIGAAKQRKDFTLVKQEIENAGCEYVSGEYKNSGSKLLLRCKCGNLFERDLDHIRQGQTKCLECMAKQGKYHECFSLDYVKSIIENNGCELISDEYINEDSELTIKCSCGNIFTRTFRIFQRGSNKCLECSQKSYSEKRRKYNAEEAKNIFSKYGFSMIGAYKSATIPVLCVCEKGHEKELMLSQVISKKSGCRQCYFEYNRGDRAVNYRGGISKISSLIRNNLEKWRQSIRLHYKKCPITGEYGFYADVHHLTSFDTILESVLSNYGIFVSGNDSISALESNDLYERILNDVISLHTIDTGILISKDIHNQFHKEYGYGKNTPQQFSQFLNDHYSITLEQIQQEYLEESA